MEVLGTFARTNNCMTGLNGKVFVFLFGANLFSKQLKLQIFFFLRYENMTVIIILLIFATVFHLFYSIKCMGLISYKKSTISTNACLDFILISKYTHVLKIYKTEIVRNITLTVS